MKKITLICITILYSITFYTQTTSISDANFKQALIDLGFNFGSKVSSVPIINISSATNLDESIALFSIYQNPANTNLFIKTTLTISFLKKAFIM